MDLHQTEPQAFLDGLGERLQALPTYCQMAYAAGLCERHFEDYLSFSRAEDWGDPDALREAIDLAWTFSLEGTTVDIGETKIMTAKCLRAVPESEDFSTPLADYALSVAIMVVHLIEFIGTEETGSVVQVASLARDIVDAKVRITMELVPFDPELEQKIATHPLMLSELCALKSNLAMLNQVKNRSGLAEYKRAVIAG